jgi:hypothetical protein
MSRMAIPRWLAVWLLTFLTYRQRELLQAGLAVVALLLCFAGFVYWLYLNRRSMRRISAERTREIQAALGPGFTLHDDNAGHFLDVLRRTSATLRRRNITQIANRFEGPSDEGRSLQLMEACYRFSSGHYAFFLWQTIACVGNQKWNFPQFSIKPRGFWSRLGLGGRGIRFQAHPRFSARFKVKCADEAGPRRFLIPLLLEEFERFPDLVVEGCGAHLVLFRPRKILEPAAFPRFQDEVRTLARLFPGEMQIPEKLLKS